MKYGFLYWHPWIYNTSIQLLYRKQWQERYKQVAKYIPEGATVIDLCAGTDLLFRQLRHKKVNYKAFDINLKMISYLRREGIPAFSCDLRRDDYPGGDVLTMCSSLYHFAPFCKEFIGGMISKAKDKVIILEPVRNAFHSTFPLIRVLGKWASIVEKEKMTFFFSPTSFAEMAGEFPQLRELKTISSGRDMLAVFDGMSLSQ